MPALKNKRHELFAQGVAAGSSFTQAAVSAGFSSTSAPSGGPRLAKVKEIAARITELRTKIARDAEAAAKNAVELASPVNIAAVKYVRQAVQDRQYRLTVNQDIVDRIRVLLDERAAEHVNSGSTIPGGKTGLLVRKIRVVGSGELAERVEEYEIDKASLTELREYLKASAIECGEYNEKDQRPVVAESEDLSGRTVEDLMAEKAILDEARNKIDALRAGKGLITASAESVQVVDSEGSSAEVEVSNDIGPAG